MAHNIDNSKGKYAFFSRKEIPWHKLGRVVKDALTSEEAIKEAALDYNVVKCPVYAKFPDHIIEEGGKKGDLVPNLFATVRDDTKSVLGHVGNRYEIVQNLDAFKFIDDIVGSKEAIFETAGALGGGEKIFITAKLPRNIRIKESDDIIEQYFLITNTHDGSGAIEAGFTPIRVVCNNTLNMALKGMANKIRFRHTKNIHDRMEQGREMLGLYKAYSMEFSEALNYLASKQIKEELVIDVIHSLVLTKDEQEILFKEGQNTERVSTRKKNTIIDMEMYMESGAGQQYHKGTALWVFNGISSYFNNGKKYKNQEDRMLNLNNGAAYRKTQDTFDKILMSI